MRPLKKLALGALAVAVILPLAPTAASAAAKKKAPTYAVGGYVPSPGRVKAHPKARTLDVLPASVDLRQYAPAVGNQGSIGSCVSWSIAHAIMGYWANRTGGSGAPYAPLYLYMRTVTPGGAPSAGTNPDVALSLAKSSGVDTMADYFQGYYGYQTAPTAGEIANAANYKVANYSRLWVGPNQGPNATTAIQQALASGNPVSLSIPVYSTFNAINSMTPYNGTGTSLGGHMITAFGYDSTGLIIRNSWGTGWGDHGDAKLAWAFVNTKVDSAYAVTGVSTPAAPVAIAPTVAALSVIKGSLEGGTSLTITGSGLADATGVTIGGNPATNLTPVVVNGSTKLTVTTPAHALGVTDVVVTNSAGSSAVSTASKYTYTPAPPALSSISPTSVLVMGGSTVTLTGSHFATGMWVTLGGIKVTPKIVSETSATFVAPAKAAGSYEVTANSLNGASAKSTLTYALPDPPVVSTMSPSTVWNFAATPVTVTGANLWGTSAVYLGGVKAAFKKVDDSTLIATMPAHATYMGTASYAIQVVTPGGVSAVNSSTWLTQKPPPAPTTTSLSASTGWTTANTVVTLNGTNFYGTPKVYIGGVLGTATKLSETQLKVTFKTHAAGAVSVQVVTPGGTSNSQTFTYAVQPPPALAGLSATSTSIAAASTTITISGTALTGATAVYVGTKAVTFVKVSDTEIRATFPKLAAGTYPVKVITPKGTSSSTAFIYN